MPENKQDRKYELISKPENDSKVEIYLNNQGDYYDDDDDEDSISLMNVFGNMKKSLRIYAWVMLFMFTLGVFAPYVYLLFQHEADSVSAVVTFAYDGAKDLKNPDGSSLDVGFIKSTYVIQEALKSTPLSKTPGITSIAENISVSRILSDGTRRQLEVMEKVGESSGSMNDPQKYIDVVNAVDYKYETSYIVTLKNGFGDEKNIEYLSGEELTELLNRIIKEYRENFFKEFDRFNLPDNSMEDINIEELDYIEWVDNITDIMDMLSSYCTSGARAGFADYRSTSDGLSFNDINRMVNLVRSVRVDYLYSYIYYNSLAKDKEKLLTKFAYQKRNIDHTLNTINAGITNGSELIANYKNSNIFIDRQSKVNENGESVSDTDFHTTSVTDYYNSLILKQTELEADKNNTEHALSNLNDKISRFSSGYSSRAKTEKVEEEIKNVNEICRKIYALVKSHAEEIRQSEAYENSFVTAIDAIYRGGFFNKENIKLAAIGGAAGLFMGFAVWFVNAFIKELKDSDMRSEAQKA